MDIAAAEKLIRMFEQSSLTYLEFEEGGSKILLKREGQIGVANAQMMLTPETSQTEDNSPQRSDVTLVTAPLVGTVYRAKEPGSKPYAVIGQRVDVGDVLCLIEAMKMFNEIKAPCDGVIEEIHFDDGDLAEFGATLFTIGSDHD